MEQGPRRQGGCTRLNGHPALNACQFTVASGRHGSSDAQSELCWMMSEVWPTYIELVSSIQASVRF